MTKQQFIEHLEDILEAQRGTLTEDEMLFNLEDWNSLAVITFIAFVDESLGVTLNASKIFEAKSVSDLVALVSGHLEG